jgi:hypothetical protein
MSWRITDNEVLIILAQTSQRFGISKMDSVDTDKLINQDLFIYYFNEEPLKVYLAGPCS